MAVATKTARTLVASQSVTGGASGNLNLTTALGALLTLRVTNGGTGPATGCLVTVNVSTDGATWRKFSEYRAGTTASATYDWAVEVPAAALHTQTVFGATSQAVTVEALAHELTSIG